MGPTAAAAQQPGGTWGEPRRTYYESNWARYGDTTDDLLAAGQHTGLAAQVAPLGVSHAVLMIGANDFNSVGFNAYFEIYNGLWSASQIASYVSGRVANVRAALDAVAPTGVRLVLVNVLDFGITPITWGSPFYSDASRRDRVTAVIQQVNAGLLSLAQEYHLVLVDAFALAQAAWGTNQSPRTTLLLGNSGLYSDFRNMENNPHGQIHVVTGGGGYLSAVPQAVNDPLFFLLHCNVDRLWAKWQYWKQRYDATQISSYDPQGTSGSPANGQAVLDTMWPWNGVTSPPRPSTAPGGFFPLQFGLNAPPTNPRPADAIDYEASSGMGFAYDDVPFK